MSVIERSIQVGYRLRVGFTQDSFASANPALLTVLLESKFCCNQTRIIDAVQ